MKKMAFVVILALALAGCGSAGTSGGGQGEAGSEAIGPQSGGEVTGPQNGAGTGLAVLTWDPNSEPDLAGYRIHYGLASRTYTRTVDVGNAATATLALLEPGMRHYFAVTAYDTSGNESAYSNEVSKDVM